MSILPAFEERRKEDQKFKITLLHRQFETVWNYKEV